MSEDVFEVSTVDAAEHNVISFSEVDIRDIHVLHDDALVIVALIHHYKMGRILVDGGSSANIIFKWAFEKMNVDPNAIKPSTTPLVGFGGDVVNVTGWVSLPVTVGAYPRTSTVWTKFLIVDRPSPYNAIMGRPTVVVLKAIYSPYHQSVKFPTEGGVGVVKGDQKSSRACARRALERKK